VAEIDIKTNGNRERSLKFMGNNAGTFKNKNTAATFSWPSYAICQTTLFPLPQSSFDANCFRDRIAQSRDLCILTSSQNADPKTQIWGIWCMQQMQQPQQHLHLLQKSSVAATEVEHCGHI